MSTEYYKYIKSCAGEGIREGAAPRSPARFDDHGEFLRGLVLGALLGSMALQPIGDLRAETLVRVETIHGFATRWGDLPGAQEAIPLPEPRPQIRTQRRRDARTRGGELCARHGLRKVFTGRYQWRCRR